MRSTTTIQQSKCDTMTYKCILLLLRAVTLWAKIHLLSCPLSKLQFFVSATKFLEKDPGIMSLFFNKINVQPDFIIKAWLMQHTLS